MHSLCFGKTGSQAQTRHRARALAGEVKETPIVLLHLWNLRSCHSLLCYLVMYHQSKHWCTQSTPCHRSCFLHTCLSNCTRNFTPSNCGQYKKVFAIQATSLLKYSHINLKLTPAVVLSCLSLVFCLEFLINIFKFWVYFLVLLLFLCVCIF